MSQLHRTALLALASALALLTLVAPASAQQLAVDGEDGEIRDYDEAKEDYSEFWERALSPAAGTYEDLVAQAASLINSGAAATRAARESDARTLLTDAIAARPNAPLAYFWLGFLEKRTSNFKACADALGSVHAIDPSFRTPPNDARLPNAWQLDYDLGLCLALSGELGAALERFDAITTTRPSCAEKRRAPDCYYWQVPWRLGETLMGLGRLEEAIATLKNANSGAVSLQYTLAVALERDEQLAASKAMIDRATSSDRNLRALTVNDRLYIPASDELYYRGVARKARGELAHSRLFFSAYLKEAPRSPWRARAQAHLDEVKDAGARSALLEVRTYGMSEAAEALTKSYAAFEKCAAGFPAQLFELRVVTRLDADGPRLKRTSERRIVTISHHDPLSKRRLSTEIIAITRCMRGVGNSMKLPKLRGKAGDSAQLRFYVAGKATDT